MRSANDIVEELREMVEESSQRAVAAELGIPHSRISEYLSGKRPLSRKAVKALGYDPTPHYRRPAGNLTVNFRSKGGGFSPNHG
jgi:transcriptional regulator with XRE-family HTH domain